ncbi:MAG: hypothetical protein IME96_01995 [Proteobacteria bacterium]|nr:hypothetical protein [Pseudomonadota bacterium]
MLKGVFTENILLKAISLLTAIVLWFIVSGERNTEWPYLIPVELKNMPANLIVTNDIPEFLDVKIQGAKSFMMEINPKEMTVKINVAELKEGSNFFPVNPNHIKLPRGAKVTRIQPSYITLKAEKLVQKEVKIRSDVQGKPAEDYYVDAVEVIPKTIEIMGAEGEIKRIRSIKTNTMDISDVKESLKKEVALDIIGRKISLVREQAVSVIVKVKEVSEKLEIKGLEVKAINSTLKSSVYPSKVNVLLEGPKSLIAAIKKEKSVKAVIDADGLAAGKRKREVRIDMPDGVKLLYLNPNKVTLRLEQK